MSTRRKRTWSPVPVAGPLLVRELPVLPGLVESRLSRVEPRQLASVRLTLLLDWQHPK